MKMLYETLRFIFISPEFLILLVGLYLIQEHPNLLDYIGQSLRKNDELLKYCPTIPIGLTAYSVHVGAKILRPVENKSNKVLYEWNGYWKLKGRVIASIVICGVSSLFSVVIWGYGKTWSPSFLGGMFIIIPFISVISSFILYLAWLKIRELMET